MSAGTREHRDIVALLLLPIGVALLFAGFVDFDGRPLNAKVRVLCFITYNFTFLAYLWRWNALIWAEHYAGPDGDSAFFVLYAGLVALVGALTIREFPEHWMLSVSFLYGVFLWKKFLTRRTVATETIQDYPDSFVFAVLSERNRRVFDDGGEWDSMTDEDLRAVCRLRLAHTFCSHFVAFGILPLVGTWIVLALFPTFFAQTLSLGAFGHPDFNLSASTWVSVFVAALSSVNFVSKVLIGIERLKGALEGGDYRYINKWFKL